MSLGRSAGLLLGIVLLASEFAHGQKIYWHHWEPGVSKIKRANLDGSNPEELIDLGSGEGVGGLALDRSGGKIYWSEQSGIRRASLDGSGVETFLVTANSPSSLAIDEVNRRIYWGRDEKFNYGINRSELDSPVSEEILFIGTDSWENGIAVDTVASKIYYVAGSIYRANLDGTQKEVVIAVPSKGWTSDLAFDPGDRKLYWPDFDGHALRRANLDGTMIEVLPIPVEHPSKITIDSCARMVYWGYPISIDGAHYRARLDGQQSQQVIPSGVNGVVIESGFDQTADKCIPAVSTSGVILLIVGLVASSVLILRRKNMLASPKIVGFVWVLAVQHAIMHVRADEGDYIQSATITVNSGAVVLWNWIQVQNVNCLTAPSGPQGP